MTLADAEVRRWDELRRSIRPAQEITPPASGQPASERDSALAGVLGGFATRVAAWETGSAWQEGGSDDGSDT